MLKFSNTDRQQRQFKFIAIILICTAIYVSSLSMQLSPILILVSLVVGILIYLMRHFRLKLKADHPYANGFRSLSNVIPIVIFITMMGYFPQQKSAFETIALGIQVLGFMGIGIFLVSTYSNRAKRMTDHQDDQA